MYICMNVVVECFHVHIAKHIPVERELVADSKWRQFQGKLRNSLLYVVM